MNIGRITEGIRNIRAEYFSKSPHCIQQQLNNWSISADKVDIAKQAVKTTKQPGKIAAVLKNFGHWFSESLTGLKKWQ